MSEIPRYKYIFSRKQMPHPPDGLQDPEWAHYSLCQCSGLIALSGAFAGAKWITVDVTSLIIGNGWIEW